MLIFVVHSVYSVNLTENNEHLMPWYGRNIKWDKNSDWHHFQCVICGFAPTWEMIPKTMTVEGWILTALVIIKISIIVMNQTILSSSLLHPPSHTITILICTITAVKMAILDPFRSHCFLIRLLNHHHNHPQSADLRNDVATVHGDRLGLFLLTLFIQSLALRWNFIRLI